jgi:hypothetical protein
MRWDKLLGINMGTIHCGASQLQIFTSKENRVVSHQNEIEHLKTENFFFKKINGLI